MRRRGGHGQAVRHRNRAHVSLDAMRIFGGTATRRYSLSRIGRALLHVRRAARNECSAHRSSGQGLRVAVAAENPHRVERPPSCRGFGGETAWPCPPRRRIARGGPSVARPRRPAAVTLPMRVGHRASLIMNRRCLREFGLPERVRCCAYAIASSNAGAATPSPRAATLTAPPRARS